MRFPNFLCLLVFGFLINFKFPFSRFPTKCKMVILMIFCFFWDLSVHKIFEKQKEVGNGRELENPKMEGCRNCVFPWRCLCSQSLGSYLVASSVLFWTSAPPDAALHFLASVFCKPVVVALVSCVGSFRRWFAHPLWICRGSSTSCRKAPRRPLALLGLNKENFAEVDYSFNFFLCKVNLIALSRTGPRS